MYLKTEYHIRVVRTTTWFHVENTKKKMFTIWSIFLLQVDFGRPLTIVAVVTKGVNFHNLDEYVKKYRMRYSNTSVNWTMVFNGTNDVSQCINLLQTIKTFCERTLPTAYFDNLVTNRHY